MSRFIPIEEFKELVKSYFAKLQYDYEPPIYKIGDQVATKTDKSESYISKVIGTGKKGVVISDCSIPLVDFGKIGTFYVYQNKLRPVNDQ